MKRAIVVATKGRPEELAASIRAIMRAGGRPDEVWVSAVEAADVATLEQNVHFIFGAAGAASQRNRALEALPPVDVVYFFDDDMLVHRTYFERCEALLEKDGAVVGVTGTLLYDGAASGAIDIESGEKLIAGTEASDDHSSLPVGNLYGCNFAVRGRFLELERFDDELPLYSWLEDLDLSRRLARHGKLRRVLGAEGVHLGSKSGGRQSHLRFGYSQVANVLYLHRKRSIVLRDVMRLILRPLLANVVGALRNRDGRRARLLGNRLALLDAARGRVTPGRITSL
ncbi:glycosyltransferase family 2 protein [Curtobacterium sp. Csp2]|uniref:glycosyltransferase family 2 protein n=1 Tax=Curtobacterium sp. Csp2 TaxID=2495430 RepID=UPI0015801B65|nr:glycosyltransferase family 2 protein [Curtobacterium sp. Csp2]QKS17547.1 glycosyltransferase family 2 protein [Curtobacterium sp. Csp2]